MAFYAAMIAEMATGDVPGRAGDDFAEILMSCLVQQRGLRRHLEVDQ